MNLHSAKCFQKRASQICLVPASFKICETQLLVVNMPGAIHDVPLGFCQMLKLP